MSIRVMSLVWDRFPRHGSEMLVMLAMADWANDQGGSLFPSNEMVAKKARISYPQAVRILLKLTRDGYLQILGRHSGGRGSTKDYRIRVEFLETLDIVKVPDLPQRKLITGDKVKKSVDNSGKMSRKLITGDKVKNAKVIIRSDKRLSSRLSKKDEIYVVNHHVNHQRERDARARASSVDNSLSLSSEKQKNGTALPYDWELSEDQGRWAEKEFNWSSAKVLEVADKFKDWFIAKPGPRGFSLDWNAEWRNWCRKEKS